MKLYLIVMNNGLSYEEYEDRTQLVVAADEAQALERARQITEEVFIDVYKPNASAVEVVEVDGYGIEVKRR